MAERRGAQTNIEAHTEEAHIEESSDGTATKQQDGKLGPWDGEHATAILDLERVAASDHFPVAVGLWGAEVEEQEEDVGRMETET